MQRGYETFFYFLHERASLRPALQVPEQSYFQEPASGANPMYERCVYNAGVGVGRSVFVKQRKFSTRTKHLVCM
jgi:hypothetical protein